MKGYYDLILKALRERGFSRCNGGKGSHEKWTNGKRTVIVPFNCDSRHTANAVMKQVGIDRRF